MYRWIISLLSAWFLGFFWFYCSAPSPKKTNLESTDAIVVFTGDSGREKYAYELWQKHLGKYLFISGVDKNTSLKQLFGVNNDARIVLDRWSRNTRENAIATARWLKQNNFKYILFITSDYHMRRSQRMLSKQLGPNVKIITHPFLDQKTSWLFWFREYNKYLFYSVLDILQVDISLQELFGRRK